MKCYHRFHAYHVAASAIGGRSRGVRGPQAPTSPRLMDILIHPPFLERKKEEGEGRRREVR